MKQLNANFIISAEKLSQCPDFSLPEFPLLGRSNVGKSSFINALANNKKLAKTSNTPGKTRLINFFNFADTFTIADLPGYGYAKVSKEAQARWQKYLEEYLLNRKQIKSSMQGMMFKRTITRCASGLKIITSRYLQLQPRLTMFQKANSRQLLPKLRKVFREM